MSKQPSLPVLTPFVKKRRDRSLRLPSAYKFFSNKQESADSEKTICKALIFFCFSLSACVPLQPAHPFDGQVQISHFAEERYSIAMNYMTQGRYGLASQQFAIAAESATSLELKKLANNGQQKANQIIINQR